MSRSEWENIQDYETTVDTITDSLRSVSFEPRGRATLAAAQHVTDDTALTGMLAQVRSLLAEDGVFIVTFWKRVRPHEDFYETFGLLSLYTTALAGIAHTQPMPFRDKLVAAFYKARRQLDRGSAQSLQRESVVGVAGQILPA